MSRTRLIVSVIFIVILGLIAAPASWAGGLKTGTAVPLAVGAGGDAVLLVDLNNDGKNDLVVAECSLNQVEIFQGDGVGGFTSVGAPIPVGTCPSGLAADKLTGGALPDIVVANLNSASVTVLQNTGAFAFTALGPYPLPNPLTSHPTGVAIADMNGDGNLDIVVADAGNNAVDILLGNGLPAFVPTTSTSSPYAVGTSPAAIVVADFDGDTKMDVAVANAGSNNVTILKNTTTFPNLTDASFSSATSTVGTSPVAIAAGVVGTTGAPDLVVANNGSSNVSVLLNNGSGVFPASGTNTPVSGAPTGIALGNFSTHLVNPKNDIIVSASDGADILFNDGTGTFGGPSVNFAAGTTPAGIAVNFIDGGTWVDAAVVNKGAPAKVSIFLGTPFSAITPVPVSAVEGVLFASTTPLLTFKYDNTPAVGQFAIANIDDWGDATASAGTVTGPDAFNVYTFEGGHKYSDPGAEGTKNISLTVTNTTDSQSISITPTSVPPSAQATVVDGTLSGALTVDLPNGTPPHTYTNATVANFTDQNTTAFNTDFSSSINWGDASPADVCAAPCATITGPQGGPFVVQGTHTYSAIGNYTITTTITDSEATQSPSAPAVVTIHANITTITPTPVTFNATEGKTLADGTVLATFTSGNASGTFTAHVDNWGDGASEAAAVTGSFPNFSVVTSGSTHKYPDEGSFTPVKITITDTNDGSTAIVNSTANVADGVIAVTGNPAVTATEGGALVGTIATFTDENTLTTTAAYTVTIDWGNCGPNGTPLACAFVPATNVSGSNGSFTVGDTHSFEEGTFTVNIKVVDNDSSQTQTAVSTVTVSDAALSNLVVNAVSGGGSGVGGELVASVDTFNGTVATFQDGNTSAPTTDFNVTIVWGDGATTNCPEPCALVQTNGGGGLFKIVDSHMFTKAGTQLTPVTVTVVDIGGAAPLGPTAGAAAVVTSLYQPTPTSITPVEGTAFTGGVGTFHATTGDVAFNITVNWADGTINAPSSVTGGPVWTVNGSHTYAEETSHEASCSNLPCALVISVTDPADGSTLSITGGTATISDAPLTPAAVAPLGPVSEGTALSGVTVLTFTDGNPGAPACPGAGCDFTATVDWGDGTAPSVGTVTGSIGGPFTVTGSHTYVEGGLHPAGACVPGAPNATCQIHVTVNDEGTPGAITNFNSTSVLVSDAPLVGGSLVVNPVSGGGSGVGGELVANVDTWNGTIATFADTNTSAPTTEFTVVIVWGDGATDTCTAPCALVQTNGGGGLFKVVTSHLFTKAGTQLTPIQVTVTDIDGPTTLGPTAGTAAVVTSLYQPVAANITPTEGVSFVGGVGTFHATTGDVAFNITVNWADGTINAPSSVTGGPVWTVNGTHTYAEETSHEAACGNLPCALVISITDPADGSSLSITGGTATILDAPLTPTAVGPLGTVAESNVPQINSVTVMTFTDLNPGAPASDFTATIDWGDGTTTAGTVTGSGGNYSVIGSHTYTEGGLDVSGPGCVAGSPATCQIHVTVNDEGTPGAITNFNSASVQVADAPLSSPSGVNLTPGGLSVINVALGTFHDANPGAPTTDFIATIDWGDTTSSAGIVTGPVGGPFTVSGSHTYLTAGTLFNVTITVMDKGGAGPVTINSTIFTPAVAGSDFLGQASPPTSVVVPGQAVDILITLTPQSVGYNNPVTFTGCQILSGGAGPINCNFSPSSVPDVVTVHTVHMFVQTFAQSAMLSAPPRPGHGNLTQLALLLPGFVGVFGMVLLGSKKNRYRTALWFGASLLLLALLLVGCGGGGPQITPGPNGTAPGTYVLRVLSSDPPPALGGNGPDIQVTVHVQ